MQDTQKSRTPHTLSPDATIELQRQALARNLADDQQPLQRTARLGASEHEVSASDVMLALGSLHVTGLTAHANSPFLRRFTGTFSPSRLNKAAIRR